MIQDILFEPIRKLAFKLQKDKQQRWYSHTNKYITPGKKSDEILYETLLSKSPVMVSRLGTSELHIILNYLSQKDNNVNALKNYLSGAMPEFWWGRYAKGDIFQNSGFFSNDAKGLNRFAELYLECMPQIDVLLSWLKGESYLEGYFQTSILKTYIFSSEPWLDWCFPWTSALANKKVLVIHPFEESIISQYERRRLLFSDERILPEFELKTIKAFNTTKGNKSEFSSWFGALDALKEQVNKQDFDIALIAAGAYGLPLAAHIKSIGKKGIHLGGFLQILFGIRGTRWERSPLHKMLVNEYWKFPSPGEHPANYKKLGHGSYW